MKTGTLGAVSVVALAVVGYAVWTMSSDPGTTERRSKRGQDVSEPDSKASGRRAKGGIRSVEPTTKGDARKRPTPGPAPKPVPKVSLKKARTDFEAVTDEYDTLLSAKAPLDNARWVELYAKGAAALIPLQQHLSWEAPDEAAELQAAQQKYRTKIDALQRQVVLEQPPTSPR